MHILTETGRLNAIPAAREALVSAHLEVASQLDLVSADVTRANNGVGIKDLAFVALKANDSRSQLARSRGRLIQSHCPLWRHDICEINDVGSAGETTSNDEVFNRERKIRMRTFL